MASAPSEPGATSGFSPFFANSTPPSSAIAPTVLKTSYIGLRHLRRRERLLQLAEERVVAAAGARYFHRRCRQVARRRQRREAAPWRRRRRRRGVTRRRCGSRARWRRGGRRASSRAGRCAPTPSAARRPAPTRRVRTTNLPKRLEFGLCTVDALPNDSSTGTVSTRSCSTAFMFAARRRREREAAAAAHGARRERDVLDHALEGLRLAGARLARDDDRLAAPADDAAVDRRREPVHVRRQRRPVLAAVFLHLLHAVQLVDQHARVDGDEHRVHARVDGVGEQPLGEHAEHLLLVRRGSSVRHELCCACRKSCFAARVCVSSRPRELRGCVSVASPRLRRLSVAPPSPTPSPSELREMAAVQPDEPSANVRFTTRLDPSPGVTEAPIQLPGAAHAVRAVGGGEPPARRGAAAAVRLPAAGRAAPRLARQGERLALSGEEAVTPSTSSCSRRRSRRRAPRTTTGWRRSRASRTAACCSPAATTTRRTRADAAGRRVATLAGHDAPVKGVAWLQPAAGGGAARAATASKDHTVRTWRVDGETSACESIGSGHDDAVECLAPTRRGAGCARRLGRPAAAVERRRARAGRGAGGAAARREALAQGGGRLEAPAELSAVARLTGHHDCVAAVCWPTATMLYSAGWDGAVKAWDAGAEVHDDALGQKAASPGPAVGAHATGHADHNLRVTRAPTRPPSPSAPPPTGLGDRRRGRYSRRAAALVATTAPSRGTRARPSPSTSCRRTRTRRSASRGTRRARRQRRRRRPAQRACCGC